MAKKQPFDFLNAFMALVFSAVGGFVFVQLLGIDTSPGILVVTFAIAFFVAGFWKRISF